MEENKSRMEYDDICKFIDSIDNYSDEEIYEKLDYIICYLQQAHLYGLAKNFKILAIKTIKNLNLKIELIKKFFYKDNLYRDYCYNWNSILSTIDNLDEKDKIIVFKGLFSNYTFDNNLQILNIPSNLKFGIELEYCKVSFTEIKKIFETKTITTIMKSLSIPIYLINEITNNSDFEKENEFDKWIFSKEADDDHLPEASSPIMTNTLDNLNQIKAICMIFKALGAQVNGETGLHINIGVDFFNDNIDALKYLLIIWSECEELFFKISNKENDVIRVCANTMSIPIKANIQKTFEENSSIVLNNEEDFTRFMYNIQVRERLNDLFGFSHGYLEFELMDAKTEEEKYAIFKKYLEEKEDDDTSIRYTSVNFNHMTWHKKDKGRIEFRLFNSSLDFETIMQSILLISKLFQTCLELANNSKTKHHYFTKLLNDKISEEEKLKILLNLLFDNEEEKEIFRKRWISVKDKSSYKNFYTGRKTFITDEKVSCLQKSMW